MSNTCRVPIPQHFSFSYCRLTQSVTHIADIRRKFNIPESFLTHDSLRLYLVHREESVNTRLKNCLIQKRTLESYICIPFQIVLKL